MNDSAKEFTFASLAIGEQARFEQTITPQMRDRFAEVSGDTNPLHMDVSYAATTQFGDVIMHGQYLGALMSRMVGMYLPGKYSLLSASYLEFKKPVRLGDVILIEAVVAHKSDVTRMVQIDFSFLRGEEIVATGYARVQLLK